MSIGGHIELIVSALAGLAFSMQSLFVGTLPATHIGETDTREDIVSILFVGDVMLGRHVESTMEERGYAYPFNDARGVVSTYDLALANFEGAIPEVHQKTPNFDMRFSVREEYLGVLRDIGFDAFSLANNHSFDHGAEGYENTVEVCAEYRVLCRGNPHEVNKFSTGIFSISNVQIGVIFVHTNFHDSQDEVTQELEMLSESTDVQFVYAHWGNEYELTHSSEQEGLAHAWIDAGADAIVGHHPHVVQDIEMYTGKPIFYSLGNFVFDQYFSSDVEVGLGVGVSIKDSVATYSLIPFESTSHKSQPRVVEGLKRQNLLARILKSIDSLTVHERTSGIFTVKL